MKLQHLFKEGILQCRALSPGYEGHASDVWLVRTPKQEVVVRASRMMGEPSSPFWWGCQQLFGIDPRRVHQLENINNALQELKEIPVPRVLQKGFIGQRECVIVEKVEGDVLQQFEDQPASVLESLGEGLACIHKQEHTYVGSPTGDFQVKLEHFHTHCIDVMEAMISRFYSKDQDIATSLPNMVVQLKELPAPTSTAYVMVDMDSTQFLSDQVSITGLVDTEAYVIAPRAFDFIGLEYILDAPAAEAFKVGYTRVLPLPYLKECRMPYRYLYRLLEVQGRVPVKEWLDQKVLF
ncbi:hypothetical protein [Aureibacillus halotolerans]|uniref:Phosphotransferase family enzyme n=1 Tax=Aureibacillus halotolerans TaxID=1508390 RepID=A0A4R6TSK0_9BACI|nr:hypothetical protein [Aureibacillus halotolerans]TDQ36608.1 hypothetical protein EV213_11772 [Aureibacillus halotolerans]